MTPPSHYHLEYLFFRYLGALVRGLPLRAALALGATLGTIAFRIVRVRREIALENLRRAFERERGEREIRRIAAELYRNMGRSLVEFLRFPLLTPTRVRELVSFVHPERLDRVARSGRGAILLTGHFGNWELMASAIAYRTRPYGVLVAPLKNRPVDELASSYRRAGRVFPIPTGTSVRELLRRLRRGEFVGIVADQDAGKDGLFVEFFGRPASTPQGPALLALRENLPILMAFIVRERKGRHRVFLEPLPAELWRDGGPEGVRRMTECYTRVLESYVRRYPDHWFWVHRRWKTRPGWETRRRGDAETRRRGDPPCPHAPLTSLFLC